MASPIDNQQTWIPYENTKDCSQGFCSLYCPQWCYIIFPPPPPFEFPNEDSGSNFSPLVIAIICILASAFLLVTYYTIISKYCGNFDSIRRRLEGNQSEEFEGNRTPSHHEAWQISTAGLDESVIKSISVCKYKKGDGLVEGTDCSVCLSEFKEEESLRLLPKCSHAFHLPCIDTWLKSHSNCPLCRANVVSAGPLQLQLPAPEPENLSDSDDGSSSLENNGEDETVIVVDDLERGEEGPNLERVSDAKSPLPSLSGLGGSEERDGIIEIRDEGIQPIRRSVSMDSSCQGRILISDVLGMSMEEDSSTNDQRFPDVGTSKRTGGEHSKGTNRNRVLHCVMSPISMKRSVSSGRFLFTRHGGRRNGVLPM